MTSSIDESPVTRKVQIAGNSTFTVSLPKEWATAHGLETGREVNLYPSDDGSLVVRVGPREDGGDERVVPGGDLSTTDLTRTVRQLYAAGSDRFRVVAEGEDGFDPEQRRALAAAGTDLTGLEVDDRAADQVGFRNVLNPSKVSLSQTVLNLQHVALSMHRDAVRSAVEADAELAETVLSGPGVTRQFLLVARQFERSLDGYDRPAASDGPRWQTFDRYAAAAQLRRVAGNAERIASVTPRLDDPPAEAVGSNLAERSREAERLVEDAVAAALDDDPAESRTAAYEVLAGTDAFREDLDPVDAAADAADPAALAVVYETLLATADCATAVAKRSVRQAGHDE
ncbi:AbrB/MazE/SpoVT family DNA-binding domain-containing protein [Halostella litorea]|uniref:AbrB/MazE/SpoVT family DNA-binding domain-containing protein n=1 Tax=Halostella litorea TaxID=2528831 RepID=UPI001092295B|nr:AbrB/MazE/SpoVT family DNA-binding domain-containing protein [Halostella litorea]